MPEHRDAADQHEIPNLPQMGRQRAFRAVRGAGQHTAAVVSEVAPTDVADEALAFPVTEALGGGVLLTVADRVQVHGVYLPAPLSVEVHLSAITPRTSSSALR